MSTVINTSNVTTIPRQWLGIYWKLLSCLFFAIDNAILRYLSGASHLDGTGSISLSTNDILLYQNSIALILLLIIFKINTNSKLSFKSLIPVHNRKLYIYRGLGFIFGTYLWAVSFKYASVTQVVLVGGIASSIITVLSSVFLLKERLTIFRSLAIILSIILAYYIIPDNRKTQLVANELLGWSIFIPAIAMLSYTMVKVFTKKITQSAQGKFCLVTLTLHFYLFILPFNLIVSGFSFPTINLEQGFWLLILGICTGFAHYSINKATYYADLLILVPFSKCKIIFSFLIDLIILKEIFLA